MRYNKLLLLTTLCSLASSTVFSANETITTKNLNSNSPFLSTLTQGHIIFELGAYQGSQGNTQHINIQDLIGDTFTVNDHNYNSALIGLGYFIDGKNLGRFNMSYGVNAFYLAPTAVSGNVIQEDLFTNLSYHYNITNIPVYLMAKATIDFKSPYALTIDVGIGPNFMRTHDFEESSLDNGVTLPDNIFSANTTTTFSATVGASLKIDHALGQLPLEVGYRFFYLGQGHFKTRNNQVLDELNTGDVYANSIFLAINI